MGSVLMGKQQMDTCKMLRAVVGAPRALGKLLRLVFMGELAALGDSLAVLACRGGCAAGGT